MGVMLAPFIYWMALAGGDIFLLYECSMNVEKVPITHRPGYGTRRRKLDQEPQQEGRDGARQ